MTESEALAVGDVPPPYMIFVVVFFFFLTGLLGFLICHLLKKKGYRCRTADMDDEEEEEGKLGGDADENEENQDTVEQILKCIIENEANMEAFNEMLGNHNVCVRHDSRLRKESIGGIPPHHHTVHSGTDHNSCLFCAQVRSKKDRRQSRTPRSKQRPGEQTVFSVGRFRVTHHDKKLHGGPNPLVSSGDQLDQSQDSEEQKEGGYNLRSMFKDVRPPSESSNGVAPNVGKRRRSLTFFGLRRGSDPAGIKVGQGAGREAGGVRFAIQQQPVVLEEQLQTENTNATHECATNPGIEPETDPSKNPPPASPQSVAKSLSSVSSQSKIQAKDPIPANEDGPSPEPKMKLSIGSTESSAPISLPIQSSASSGEAFKIREKGDVEEKVFKNEEAHDPGPLQTSTHIASMHESIPGFTSVIPTDRPEPESSRGFPVTQTLSDPSSSSDLEPDGGASLVFISLGSSPPSSVSLLKTPTTPLSVTPSPNRSRSRPLEASTATFPLYPTPSPKYPSGQAASSQSPVPSSSFEKSTSPLQAQSPSLALSAASHLQTPSPSPAEHNLSIGSSLGITFKSESVTCVTSMGKRDMASSPSSVKEVEEEGARIPKREEEKTEIRRTGMLKTAQLSPPAGGDSKTSALSSSTDQLSKGGLGNQPLSPLSPSSPTGSRVSSVTIIKASPDSRREFSVVTMVAEDQSSPSIQDKKEESNELESEKVGMSPVDGQGTNVSVLHSGLPESQCEEMSGAEERPMGSPEKDDMVEMDDIKDCKVTQVE